MHRARQAPSMPLPPPARPGPGLVAPGAGLRIITKIYATKLPSGNRTSLKNLQQKLTTNIFAAFDLNFGPCLPPSKIPAKTYFFDFGTPVYVAYRGPRRTGANAMQAPPGASPCVKTRLAATRLGPSKMVAETGKKKKKKPIYVPFMSVPFM